MRSFITVCFAALIFSFSIMMPGKHASSQQPEYVKNGRIAIAVIKEVYPEEDVRGYKYAGRKQKSKEIAVDSFLFRIKALGSQRVAAVYITHDTENNEMLSLTVTEQILQ